MNKIFTRKCENWSRHHCGYDPVVTTVRPSGDMCVNLSLNKVLGSRLFHGEGYVGEVEPFFQIDPTLIFSTLRGKCVNIVYLT